MPVILEKKYYMKGLGNIRSDAFSLIIKESNTAALLRRRFTHFRTTKHIHQVLYKKFKNQKEWCIVLHFNSRKTNGSIIPSEKISGLSPWVGRVPRQPTLINFFVIFGYLCNSYYQINLSPKNILDSFSV